MALQHGLRTAWSVPIVSKNGEPLGTFGLHHAQLKSVGQDEIELLEKAGHIALIAIEPARAQAALTDALAEVKKSEAELRTIAEMIPQMIAVPAPDGQALYLNDIDAEIHGPRDGRSARCGVSSTGVSPRRCRTPARGD